MNYKKVYEKKLYEKLVLIDVVNRLPAGYKILARSSCDDVSIIERYVLYKWTGPVKEFEENYQAIRDYLYRLGNKFAALDIRENYLAYGSYVNVSCVKVGQLTEREKYKIRVREEEIAKEENEY